MKKLALCLFLSAVLLAGVIAPAVAAEPVALAAAPSATLFDRKDGSENHVDITVTIPESVNGNKFLRLEIDGVPFAVDRDLVRQINPDTGEPVQAKDKDGNPIFLNLEDFAVMLASSQLAPNLFVSSGFSVDEMKAFLGLKESDVFPPKLELLDFKKLVSQEDQDKLAALTEFDYMLAELLSSKSTRTGIGEKRQYQWIAYDTENDASVDADKKAEITKSRQIAAARVNAGVKVDAEILKQAKNGKIIGGTAEDREALIDKYIADEFNEWVGAQLQEAAAFAAVLPYVVGRIAIKNGLTDAAGKIDPAKLAVAAGEVKATVLGIIKRDVKAGAKADIEDAIKDEYIKEFRVANGGNDPTDAEWKAYLKTKETAIEAQLDAQEAAINATVEAYYNSEYKGQLFDDDAETKPNETNIVAFSDVLKKNLIGTNPLKAYLGKGGVPYVAANLVPKDPNVFNLLASDLVTLYAGKRNVSFIFGVGPTVRNDKPVAEVIEHVVKFELTVVDTTVYSVLDNSEEGGTLTFSGNTVKAFSDADGKGAKVTGGNDVTIKIAPDKGNSIAYVYVNGVSADQVPVAREDAVRAYLTNQVKAEYIAKNKTENGGKGPSDDQITEYMKTEDAEKALNGKMTDAATFAAALKVVDPYPFWKISEDFTEIVILNVASDNSIMVQFYGVPDNGIDGNVMLWILLGVLTAGALTLAFVSPVRKRAGK